MLEDRRLSRWLKPRSLTGALVVALCLIAAAPARSEEQPEGGAADAIVAKHPWIGQPAPDIDLVATTGDRVRLGDLNGEKLVVMHFAASW